MINTMLPSVEVMENLQYTVPQNLDMDKLKELRTSHPNIRTAIIRAGNKMNLGIRRHGMFMLLMQMLNKGTAETQAHVFSTRLVKMEADEDAMNGHYAETMGTMDNMEPKDMELLMDAISEEARDFLYSDNWHVIDIR
jgi:hypothetical protein